LKANDVKKVHTAEKKQDSKGLSKSNDDKSKNDKKSSHGKSKSDKIAED
jgi:hypothetical protein